MNHWQLAVAVPARSGNQGKLGQSTCPPSCCSSLKRFWMGKNALGNVEMLPNPPAVWNPSKVPRVYIL